MAFRASKRQSRTKDSVSKAVTKSDADAIPTPLTVDELIGGPASPSQGGPTVSDASQGGPASLSQGGPVVQDTRQSGPASPDASQGGVHETEKEKETSAGKKDVRMVKPSEDVAPRQDQKEQVPSAGYGNPSQTTRPYPSYRQGIPSTGSRPSAFRRPYGNGESSFTQNLNVPTETVKGILDIMPEGHGFLRPKFTPSERDVYISQSQIRRFLLRNGDMVEGQARPPKENERYWGLLKVEKVNEMPAEEMESRPKFEDLTPVYPNKMLILETGQLPLSSRIIDLVAPIGFGQRGLIVSPPKAGKTTILKEIAAGVAANYPDVHLMAALIGERPEEVTDITRSVHGEVLASNFDESPQDQTRIAEVALDRAKRLVEMGRDVVILLDSITRLARAYNLVVNPSGRTLSGGFDPAALYPAKRFLGAARCVEPSQTALALKKSTKNETSATKSHTNGGSLTVIGTALIETGSRMDDLIYEEFKGTGNMELTLSRALQERRIFPAIDIGRSGTRHDELLLGEDTMKKVTTLRHMVALMGDEERTLMVVERLSKSKSNSEFLDSLAKG